MTKFFYVYILQSEVNPQRFYIGLTDDLRTRLKNHNSGRIVHTSKWKPWQVKTYIALCDRDRAARLERYLKSASGRAFASDISNSRSSLRRFIFDLRFAIVDLSKCARRAWRQIESRRSKFENSAAPPPHRACSSVG
jgi:putative endonuclease